LTAAANGAQAEVQGEGTVLTETEAQGASTVLGPPASRLSYFIDGAHTPESMVTCAQWYAQAVHAHGVQPSELGWGKQTGFVFCAAHTVCDAS